MSFWVVLRGSERPMVLSTGTRAAGSCMRTRPSGAWLPLSPSDPRDLVLHKPEKRVERETPKRGLAKKKANES